MCDRLLLRNVDQKVLRRRLVLGEAPQPVELRQLPDEAALWALWHRMGPAICRHGRIVALGDRPGARRVHDARAFAGNEPAVVAGVIPGIDLRRTDCHNFAGEFHRLPRLVGVDLDVVLGVDHHHAVGIEQRADPIDRVGGLSHRQADREAGLVQLLRRVRHKRPRSRYRSWPCPISTRRLGKCRARRCRRALYRGRSASSTA